VTPDMPERIVSERQPHQRREICGLQVRTDALPGKVTLYREKQGINQTRKKSHLHQSERRGRTICLAHQGYSPTTRKEELAADSKVELTKKRPRAERKKWAATVKEKKKEDKIMALYSAEREVSRSLSVGGGKVGATEQQKEGEGTFFGRVRRIRLG